MVSAHRASIQRLKRRFPIYPDGAADVLRMLDDMEMPANQIGKPEARHADSEASLYPLLVPCPPPNLCLVFVFMADDIIRKDNADISKEKPGCRVFDERNSRIISISYFLRNSSYFSSTIFFVSAKSPATRR
jgi:hypothetical protein